MSTHLPTDPAPRAQRAGRTIRARALRSAVAVGAAGLAAALAVSSAPAHAASTSSTAAAKPAAAVHQDVVYYQTQYNGGSYVSPLPMLTNHTGVTDVIVAAIHLDSGGIVHLNDNSPDDPMFTQMWSDLATMQASGVKVEAMLGGAAPGSYANLATDFSEYYPLLKNLIVEHHLDGIDLDVEESESLASIEQLINQLRSDFGSSFLITMAPVASALEGGGNISGFSYDDLVHADGSAINWYNAQFYCGWGSLSSTANYDAIVAYGLVPASKLVAGAVTNPSSCSGYVAPATLEKTVKKLVAEHPDFGGVAGWEYFNSEPGGTAAPWEWAAGMSAAM
ncbi:MAG TPA: glycosyl hydrolase family 18 protein, partial [Dactylosporangium sp.]|jgi:chitinase|nr:glycosyl hydrolase family 18 protein [Dactylosporangium sp.]